MTTNEQRPIVMVDLKSGNLLSLQHALKEKGGPLTRVMYPQDYKFSGDEALVLPGQGRFAFVTERLDEMGWRPFLRNWLEHGGRLVGICVGMQILFEGSEEDPDSQGLGYLKGRCQRLQHAKIPMVGWAKLDSYKLNMKDQYAYFVNSYAAINSEYATAKVHYGQSFCAAVQRNNVYGFQFHPEKSGHFGRQLLSHVCR